MGDWSRSLSEGLHASTRVKVLIVNEGRHVPALVHDPQDHWRTIGSVKLLEENHVALAIDGSHSRQKKASVPADARVFGDPLECRDQMTVVDQPLVPAPRPGRVVTDVFQIGPC